MKVFISVCVLASVPGFALADEPDGLKLPPGFHAAIVADGLGSFLHLAVRANGDIYVSTAVDKQNSGGGIIALQLDAKHRADQIEHFGHVEGGTGIRFYNGALYASNASGVYRFGFKSDGLLPGKDPDLIIDGMPTDHPGFNRINRQLAFDGRGSLFIALDAAANMCNDPNTPKGAPAVGLRPCPDLGKRAGVWRFDATKTGQRFPDDGEQLATGIRDTTSLDWSPNDSHLYTVIHGRDGLHAGFPQIISDEDENNVADEMHRITKGTDLGWPYTYYDGVRRVRLIAPEYGGNGKQTAPEGTYSKPVLTFQSRRGAPVDLLFYTAETFPVPYRGGAFIVLHGTRNQSGYSVMFVPFDRNGAAGPATVFADGFAAFDASGKTPGRAKYRPIGAAVGPDGALYIADSQEGRIWRIAYGKD